MGRCFAYSKDGRAEAFYRHLPEHRKRSRPRRNRHPHRIKAFEGQSLSRRPERVAARNDFGHWECDLMMFRKEHGTINVTSLVERVSRFAVVMRNEDCQSKPIMEALINGLAPLPVSRRCRSASWPLLPQLSGAEAAQQIVFRRMPNDVISTSTVSPRLRK